MNPVVERLAGAISPDSPGGENLEDTQLLASFDGYRVFGQITAPADDLDWREIRDKSLEALAQSRDLRLLAHLGAATLRTGGIGEFCDVVAVAARWFEGFPEHLHPKVDEDAILRKNALNCFADRMAIIDAVRRKPFLVHPQLGAFALRHWDIAAGKLAASESEGQPPTDTQLNAALAQADAAEIAPLEANIGAAVGALKGIDAAMRGTNGVEAAPDLDALVQPLEQMRKTLADELTRRAPAASEGDGAGTGTAATNGGVIGVAGIRSRDDAIRALDAVAAFFRTNEPSSPIPLVVDRAKRLVSLDFLAVLADIAPDGLDQAKRIGGIQDE